MADRYWVGGTASWDGTAGTKWATASGGAGGAAVPTTSDNVFIDANSGAVTVTIAVGNTGCANLNFTGFTGTLAGVSALTINGNLTVAAGMTWSNNSALTFTGTGAQTITTAGKTLNNHHTFTAPGGTYTLQDALVMGTGCQLTLTAGTLDANGFNVTCPGGFSSTGTSTRAFDIAGVTVTIAAGGSMGWTVSGSNLTLTVDTSTHITNPSLFTGNGLTYNDVTMAPNTTSMAVTGANTFRNFTCSTTTAHTFAGLNFAADQVVTGTLTLSSSAPNIRGFFRSNTIGTPRTITAAVTTLSEFDFQDITAAGAGTWTGTRLGDCKGNSGITFTAAANKYWVGNTGNWSAAATEWATASGGAAGANNLPLPQDTCIFDANSFSGDGNTVTIEQSFRVGTIDFTATDQLFTFAVGAAATFFGDITFDSNLTMSGTTTVTFAGRTTQTLTTVGKAWTAPITVDSPGGTFTLGDALTMNATHTFTLTRGTLNLNNQALSVGLFSSSNTNTRAITSGGATLTLTGTGSIWLITTVSGLTLNDALQVTATDSSAATRSFNHGGTSGGTETNCPSVNITAGTGVIGMNGHWKNLDYTGWAGSHSNGSRTIYGNLTASTGMTWTAGAATTTFGATSGTKTITSNGKTMNFPLTFNGVGGTWQLADNLTVDATNTTTLTNGTLDINGKTLSTGFFSTSNSNARTIKSTAANGKITTTSTTATTVFTATTTTNLTVTRNSWTIEIGGNTTNVRTCNLGSGITWPAISFTNTTANGGLDLVCSGTTTVIKSLSVSTPPQTIRRTASTTITIEDNTTGFPSGTAGNLITIGSITAASHTWTKSGGGQIDSDYLSISRSTATPASTWYANTTSTDGGNNSGWVFGAPPELFTASEGTFALNGQTASFITGFSIAANQGSFALNGQTSVFKYTVVADQGNYTLNGQTAISLITNPVAEGSFALNGQDVSLVGVFSTVASQGAFVLTGQDIIPDTGMLWSDNNGTEGTRFNINADGTQLIVRLNGTTYVSDTFASIDDGAFHHIAVSRSNGTIFFWVDGISVGSFADTTDTTGTGAVRIGDRFTGHIDDVRVTKGVNRYAGVFDVPFEEFPDQG